MSRIKRKNNKRQSAVIKHRRIRAQLSLPAIRGHYHNYADAGINWLRLFNLIDGRKKKKQIIAQYHAGIKYKTAMRRYTRWVKEGKQQKLDTSAVQDNRGGHNAAMTVEEEELCAEYIKANYLEKTKKINQEDVRTLILAFYKQIHPHVVRGIVDLTVGGSFITRFMKKYDLVNRNGKSQ